MGYVFKEEQGNVTVQPPSATAGIAKGEAAKRTRAYLDTSMIVGLAKRDLRPTEREALREPLRLGKAGRIELLTSSVTGEVTDDWRTIVSRASEIEARVSIRVVLPSRLVAELSDRDAA